MENENSQERELKMVRTLKAPIELVWEAWTKPEHIAQWWGPKGFTVIIHEMDFREGGEWRLDMRDSAGKNYPNRSIFKEIILLRKIKFEHFNPHFITTVLFEPIGNETRIEWSSLFDSAENLQIILKTFDAKQGQKENFEKLENYLQKIKKY